jgi:hypothetical protein
MMEKKSLSFLLCILLLAGVLFSGMSCKRDTIQGPNRAPIARAGADIQALVNERVMFNGQDSFDPDGDLLTYEWKLLACPQFASAELGDRRGVKSCFITPDKPGVWIVALTVCDGKKLSERDVVKLRVNELEPAVDTPDLEVPDVAVFGSSIDNKKYIREIRAKVKSNNVPWTQPLGFRVIAMDELMGGQFTFDESMTINSVCLRKDDEKWYTLVSDRLEWPEGVTQISFAAKVDPGNLVDETMENNNMAEITIQRTDLMEAPPNIYYQAPDFSVSDFYAKGIYNDAFVNRVKAKIKNRGKKYNGPLSIKFIASSSSQVLLSRLVQIDNVCLEQRGSTWIDLSSREIRIPENLSTDNMPLAASIDYSLDVDFSNRVEEMDEDNNRFTSSPLVMDLLPYCSVSVSNEIRVRGPDARMYTIRNGHPFRFDISSGKKFDFFITLMNYCSPENSTKIDIVFDWAPLKSDGDNIVLKKNLQVHFPYAGQLEIDLENIKIPSKQKFQRDFSTFAILAHHEKGYDVLFSSPVEVRD